MVSIVEVEIFGYLSFSNWPDFDQKWLKIGNFGPQRAKKLGNSDARLWKKKEKPILRPNLDSFWPK